jgi:Bacterial inner membrane protein
MMERMLAVMADHPAAAGAGIVAMVCLAIWPLFRARWAMLTAYIGNNLGFAVHYALLGQWTAVAMNGVMAAQTAVAILLVRTPRLRWAYHALAPALALASLMTWQGLPSFLSAAATALSTLGRLQTNEVILRALLLASTPFWAAHDLVVGSLPGLVADLLSMATGAAMLLRRAPAARTALVGTMRQPGRLVSTAGPFGRRSQVTRARPAAAAVRSAQPNRGV